MTTEQAIKELKSDRELYGSDIVYAGDGTPEGNLMLALDMGIAALEKQIPKKPYFGEALGYKSYLCPICRGWLLYPDERPTLGDTFCSFCGQKIDWPEVKNE